MNATKCHPIPEVRGIRLHEAESYDGASLPSASSDQRLSFLLVSPDGILYDDTLWWRQLMQLLAHFGLHTTPRMIASLWRQDYYDDVCRGQRDLFSALREFLSACGLRPGQIDEACAASRLHWRKLVLQLRAYPQTPLALSRLQHSGWRLGLIVHSALDAQEIDAQLARMGIRDCFDRVFCSREEDSDLCDTAFWRELPARLQLHKSSVVYVGAEERYLSQAKTAGLTTVGFRCGRECADTRFQNLEGLVSLKPYASSLSAA